MLRGSIVLFFVGATAFASGQASAQPDFTGWVASDQTLSRLDRTVEGRPSMPFVLTGESARHGPAIRARRTVVGDSDSPSVAMFAGRALFPGAVGDAVGLWFLDHDGLRLLGGPTGLASALDVPPTTDFEVVFDDADVDAIDLAPTGHVVVRGSGGDRNVLYRWSPGTDTFCRIEPPASEGLARWSLRDDGAIVFLAQSPSGGNVYLTTPPPSPELEPCPATPPAPLMPVALPFTARPEAFAIASDGETMVFRVDVEGGIQPACTLPEPAGYDPDTARTELWRRNPDGTVCRTLRTSTAIPGGPVGSLGIMFGPPVVSASGSTLFGGNFRFRAPPGESRQRAGLLIDGVPIIPPCDLTIESNPVSGSGACDDPALPQVELDSRYFMFDDGTVLTEIVEADGSPSLALWSGGTLVRLPLSYVRLHEVSANPQGNFVLVAELDGTVPRLAASSPNYTPFFASIANRTLYQGDSAGSLTPMLSVGECVDVLEGRVVPCDEHEIVDAPSLASEYDHRYQRVAQLALARRDGLVVPPSPEGEVCFRYRTTGFNENFAHVCAGAPERVPLVGLEVIQSVQSWQNAVFLVEGADTLVRAHFEHPASARVQPVLRAFRGGIEVGTARPAENFGAYTRAAPDAQETRAQRTRAAFFHLEEGLTTGDVELRVEGGGGYAIRCEEPEAVSPVGLSDPAGDCTARVRFEPTPTLSLRLVTGRWSDASGVHETVSQAQIDVTLNRIRRMLPIARIDVIGGRPHELIDVFTLRQRTDALQQVNTFATAEGCNLFDCSAVYLGLFRDANNRAIGGDSTTGSGTAAAFIGNRGYETSPPHEVGHALGLHHAEYCGAATTRVPLAIPDVATIDGVEVPLLGPLDPDEERVYALDPADAILDPETTFELMSYCGASRWTSRFTYELLRDLHARIVDRAPGATPRRLNAIRGRVVDGAVELDRVGDAVGVPTEDDPAGTYSLEVRDESGAALSSIRFDPATASEEPWRGPGEPASAEVSFFAIMLEAEPAATEIVILRDGSMVASRERSASPTVSLEAPSDGDTLGPGEVVVRYDGEDGDNDELVYTVRFSPDAGVSWRVLALETQRTELQLDASAFEATTDGRLEVIASDGFSVARAEVGSLSVGPTSRLSIEAPSTDRLFVDGQQVILEASHEGVDAAALVWRSDLAGELGRGERLAVQITELSEGRHSVTVESGGLLSDPIDLRVARFAPVASDLAVLLDAPSFGLEPSTVIEVEARLANRGPETARSGVLTLDAPTGMRWSTVEPERGRCNIDVGRATCDLGRIPVGQDVRVTATFNAPPEPALLVVTSESPVTSADVDGGNNVATLDLGVGQPMLPLDPDPPGDTPGDGCGCRIGVSEAPSAWFIVLVAALLARRRSS